MVYFEQGLTFPEIRDANTMDVCILSYPCTGIPSVSLHYSLGSNQREHHHTWLFTAPVWICMSGPNHHYVWLWTFQYTRHVSYMCIMQQTWWQDVCLLKQALVHRPRDTQLGNRLPCATYHARLCVLYRDGMQRGELANRWSMFGVCLWRDFTWGRLLAVTGPQHYSKQPGGYMQRRIIISCDTVALTRLHCGGWNTAMYCNTEHNK